jgi:flagellar biosynthesis regulator FlaF
MAATGAPERMAGLASSGAVRARGTLGMLDAPCAASTASSSLISALYLTCRIWTTCHQVNILAH